jgi:hypothetical protein
MPSSYTFCGTIAHDFAWSRDAHAVIIGHVEPGDVRDFDGPAGSQAPEGEDPRWYFPAPTDDWFSSDGELPKRLPDPEPEDEPASEPESGTTPPALPPIAPRPLTPPPASEAPDVTEPHEA